MRIAARVKMGRVAQTAQKDSTEGVQAAQNSARGRRRTRDQTAHLSRCKLGQKCCALPLPTQSQHVSLALPNFKFSPKSEKLGQLSAKHQRQQRLLGKMGAETCVPQCLRAVLVGLRVAFGHLSIG